MKLWNISGNLLNKKWFFLNFFEYLGKNLGCCLVFDVNNLNIIYCIVILWYMLWFIIRVEGCRIIMFVCIL